MRRLNRLARRVRLWLVFSRYLSFLDARGDRWRQRAFDEQLRRLRAEDEHAAILRRLHVVCTQNHRFRELLKQQEKERVTP